MSRLLANLTILSAGLLLLSGCSLFTKSDGRDAYRPLVVVLDGSALADADAAHTPAVESGEWALAQGNGAERVRPAKGLLAGTIVAEGIDDAGGLVRLVEALAETRSQWGIAVAPSAGARVETSAGRLAAHGEGPIILVDMKDARVQRRRGSYENVRVSVIWPGDAFSISDRYVRFATNDPSARAPAGGDAAELPAMLGTAARRGMATRGVTLAGHAPGSHELLIRVDEQTMVFGASAGEAGAPPIPTVSNLRVDVLPVTQ